MKATFRFFLSLLMVCILAVAGFSQRGRSGGSFGGGGSFRSSFGSSSRSSSGSFTRSTPSYSAPRSTISRPTGSFTRSTPTRSFGSPRTTTTTRSGSFARSRPTTRISAGFRVGYRPSLSVHYYGHPYLYGGRSIYWYGGGYYSYGPGMPLYLGNAGMPGYGAAYSYDPGYDQTTTTTQNPDGSVTTTTRGVNPVFAFVMVVFALVIIVWFLRALAII